MSLHGVLDSPLRFPNKPTVGTPLDLSNPLCRGLVRYWHFGEGAGNQVADIDNVAGGSLKGTNLSWAAGPSWSFDGSTSYADSLNDTGVPGILPIVNPSQYFTDSASCSVMAWFNPVTPSSGNFGTLLARWDKLNGPPQNTIWGLWTYSDGTCYWAYNSNDNFGDTNRVVSSNTYTAGKWNHAVGVYCNTQTSSQMALQLNGIVTNTQTIWFSQVPSATPKMTCGYTPNTGGSPIRQNLYPGKILALAVWHRYLNLDEMQRLYREPWSIYLESPLRRYFRSAAPTCQPLVPRVPEFQTKVSDRGLRFSQIVANILNSLLAKCQIVPTGVDDYSISLMGAGSALGVASMTNQDLTLTVNPTTGNVVVSLNLGHANTWTGTQTFPNASIPNATLVNSSVTINAPAFQTGWGSVALGGTLSPSWSSETANTVLAGPSSGAAAAPTFRALTATDLPGGSASITINAPSFQTGWGTVALGGSLSPSWSNETANTVLAGPTSGAAAAPTFRALTAADLPGGSASITINAPAFQTGWGTVALGGTLSPSWSNETANTVLAGPASGGAAAPTFRALVAGDYPIPSGATLPASPSKQFFLHTPVGRTILYFYDGTSWNPLYVDGNASVFVDSASGTDDLNHGTGAGANAFRSISFAVAVFKTLVAGNVTITISGATYDEQVTIQGIFLLGPYSFMLKGTRASDTLGNTTNGTWTNPAGNGSAGFTTVSVAGTPWVAHAFQNKWLEITSGTGNGQAPMLVHDNTNNTITFVGNFADIGLTLGDSSSNFHVYGNATTIDAQNTRNSAVLIQGVPGVVLTQLNCQNAVLFCVEASGGSLQIDHCLVQNSLINLLYAAQAQSVGTAVTNCAFLGSTAAEVYTASGAIVGVISQCRMVGSNAGVAGLSVNTLSIVNSLGNSWISETGSNSQGLTMGQQCILQVVNYLEIASCNSNGVHIQQTALLNAATASSPATTRLLNNGGYGVLSETAGQGAGVSAFTYTGNTLGTFSPNTALVGGNS